MLEYVIFCGGVLVARFMYEIDRDIAMIVMAERNPEGTYSKGCLGRG